MEGSGQDVLLRACVGLLRSVSGCVTVNGKDMTHKNYLEFMENDVSFLPASRLEEGLVPGLTLAEHVTITEEGKKPLFIDKSYFRKQAEKKIDEYHIIKERCALGASIFFISADLDEILRYSDRILVFFSGRVSSPLDASQTSLEKLGLLIGGKGWDQEFAKEEHDESNPKA